MRIQFSQRELRDLAIAWLALGVAFTILIDRTLLQAVMDPGGGADLVGSATVFALSLVTVGVGFLLHELAHKVVAIHFGQIAEFRADYNMLFLAIVGAMVGFLFAAPGAVYHRGRVTARENGLISVAGPVTNLALAVVFLLIGVGAVTADAGGFLVRVGELGVTINLLLAGFNMLPFGPLDGRKVLSWSKVVYAVVAVPSILLGAGALFVGL